MAITYQIARAILQEHRYRPIKGRILLVGRQTIRMTLGQTVELIKKEGIKVRARVKVECDKKTLGSEGHNFITDRTFFALFTDATTVAMDVSEYEGAEIVCNLNREIPENLWGQFDFIFNGSCLDNLFDPASALKNMSRILAPRGRIMHIEHGSPIRGAYVMYSPAYFFDFYAINNFDDCKIYVCLFNDIDTAWAAFEWNEFHYHDGKWQLSDHMIPYWNNVLNLVIAEKGECSTNDLTPIQAFYRLSQGGEVETDEIFCKFKAYAQTGREYTFDWLSAPAESASSNKSPSVEGAS